MMACACDPALALVGAERNQAAGISDSAAAFANVSDAPAMRAVFAQRLPMMFAQQCEVEECAIPFRWRKVYAKASSWHKSTFSLCYRLRVRDGTGEQREEWLLGHAYLRTEPGATDSARASYPWHWPDFRLLLRRYVDDPALPQLKRLARAELALAELAPARWFPSMPLDPHAARVSVISYRPGVRCSLRYDLATDAEPVTLFAKTYADGMGAQVYRRLEHCWRNSQRGGAPLVARPLDYWRGTGTVWQLGVFGAAPQLNLANSVFLGSELGQQLARLHAGGCEVAPGPGRAQLLAEARKKAVKLANAYPDHSDTLRELIRAAARGLAALPPEGKELLHGDLHLGQLLLAPQGIVWCDLDEMARGDAEFDIANLLVELEHHGVSATVVARFSDALAAAYRDAAARAIDAKLLAWHARLHWLNRAYRAFLRCDPVLPAQLSRLLLAALNPFANAAARKLES